jgi:hypothetical protein
MLMEIMKNCSRCGSYAINLYLHGRNGSRSDLCDVCYWRNKYEDVKDYTQHKGNCAIYYNSDCDCGLDKLLKGGE